MVIELRIMGNDLELGGQKVARLFDVSGTLLDQLNDAIDRANTDPKITENKIGESYEKGFQAGWQQGYENSLSNTSRDGCDVQREE